MLSRSPTTRVHGRIGTPYAGACGRCEDFTLSPAPARGLTGIPWDGMELPLAYSYGIYRSRAARPVGFRLRDPSL